MTIVKPEDVLDASKAMLAMGLVSGTAGNVSGRVGEERICLTPSSVPYETMTLDDLVITDLDGNVLEGTRGPTSEKALHLACFRRYPEIGGVIHCHAAYATMFGLVHEPIPAIIEEVVVYLGGDVDLRLQAHRERRARRGGGVAVGRPQRRDRRQPRHRHDGRHAGQGAAQRRADGAHRDDRVGRACPWYTGATSG